MKIRVVMLDDDSKYLSKISKALSLNYSDKIELYIFTSEQSMIESVDFKNIHVILAKTQLFDFKKIEEYKVGKAYFSELNDIDSIQGLPTVNKFQKVESIYQEIKAIYEEAFDASLVMQKRFSETTRLITYTSFCGGTGTSIIAISEAISKSKSGLKVLYLNLEYFDTTNIYFPDNSKNNFSNVIFNIKKGGSNLPSKLESLLSKDETGVYYYNPSDILIDKLELNNVTDITNLFNALKVMNFDCIIIDRNINFSEEERIMMSMSDSVRFVVDGRKITIYKFLKMMNSLAILDSREETNICSKVEVVYNKMSSTFNNTIQDENIKILATINKYKTNNDRILIDEIVSKGILVDA